MIDQLLLAVGAWSAQLHDEVYVFDDGYWQKNSKLWESVQDASWEEVILDRKYFVGSVLLSSLACSAVTVMSSRLAPRF